ncbi:uncharacterized protein ACA1_075330 [Acanthamoeba castellanii str. Neff]|uniref:Uncharacterized protein n=1 Tax=Acanthamoeba castellanii (strain ATCC 30010 / Neff) TaxID=1257118 RepID=L8HEJ8_ACACF|nr:uncharacterized protein ACA1_075330 [Acanthamoeba castellanii str. Neff]ELR23954.1 hypothetical protein ACA1_075330 [Acanthamoeba castellanii str. Neff]
MVRFCNKLDKFILVLFCKHSQAASYMQEISNAPSHLVQFNTLMPEDYFLSFTMPAPGLWHNANQKPVKYGQKPQEAGSLKPGKYLNAFAPALPRWLLSWLATMPSL